MKKTKFEMTLREVHTFRQGKSLLPVITIRRGNCELYFNEKAQLILGEQYEYFYFVKNMGSMLMVGGNVPGKGTPRKMTKTGAMVLRSAMVVNKLIAEGHTEFIIERLNDSDTFLVKPLLDHESRKLNVLIEKYEIQ